MPCGLFLSLLPYLSNDGDVVMQCFLMFVDSKRLLVHLILLNTHHLSFVASFIKSNHSLPEDVTMEQLLDVLGETRLKKMARKNRRSRNQKIREGKVVLNERGEWVERD